MKHVFVDETSDTQRKDYRGICCALVDSHSYKVIKEEAQKILHDSGWDPKIEFKGDILFSAKSGDKSIPVEKRKEIATSLIKLNTAKKYSRIKFAYCDYTSKAFAQSYLECLPGLIDKLLPKAEKGAGKDILSFHYDCHCDLSNEKVREIVKPIIEKKGYILFEDVVSVTYSFETMGILYADLIAYLYGRFEIFSKDDAVKSLTAEQQKTDGRYRKLESSEELLALVKSLNGYDVS